MLARAFLSAPGPGVHLMEAMVRPTKRAGNLFEAFQRDGSIVLNTVTVERRNNVGHITLGNLGCLNAEDLPMLQDLETAVDLVLLDDKIRVGVLRGAQMTHPKYAGRRVFCSGLNLRALAEGQIPVIDYLIARELGLMSKLHRGLIVDGASGAYGPRLEKPWVAAVDSFAIGGGMQLLLVVDWIVAASDVRFSLPAAQEGFLPGLANLRLSRSVGARLARRLILGGATIRAADPEARLICDQIVAPEEMDVTVDAAAHALSSNAALVNRVFLNRTDERSDEVRKYLAEFAVVQAQRMHSTDVIVKVNDFCSSPNTSQQADRP